MQKYFEVGQIVNTFGVKGILKVKPFTDDAKIGRASCRERV